MGTPASLKESDGDDLRLELIMEPNAAQPAFPAFYRQPVIVNRRILGRLRPESINEAMAWARKLKEAGTVEEFTLGPSTLEDVYVKLVKNPDSNGNNGGGLKKKGDR